MPPCPSYPPCTLTRSSVDASSLLKEVVSVDASKIVIVGSKGEVLVEYDCHETVVEATTDSAPHLIHYFIPTEVSISRLKQYKGLKIIIQLNNDEGTEPLEVVLNLRQ